MDYYAEIDVSLEQSSVCVVDASGKIVREAKVASESEALVDFFRQLGLPVVRLGLEAEPLSQWLHAGLTVFTSGTARIFRAVSASKRERKLAFRPGKGVTKEDIQNGESRWGQPAAFKNRT